MVNHLVFSVLQHGIRTVVLFLVATAGLCWSAPKSGDIEINVVDEKTGEPIACRLHLKNARGVARKAPKLPFLKDHFCFDGKIALELREGNYTFEAESGPEYHTRAGHFTLNRFGTDFKTITMRRIVDMSAKGWWAGDLYVRRRSVDMPLLMRAEDLHVAQVATWTNKKDDLAGKRGQFDLFTLFDTNRYLRLAAGRDVRTGGALSIFHLNGPELSAGNDTLEYPVQLLEAMSSNKEIWVDADTPTAWDLPVWVAHGVIDSVRLAHHRYGRLGYLDKESGQRPRDKVIYGDAGGLGRWSNHVYYQLLNCGLRLPPSAGSGSGDVANPVGYNRMYVYCGQEFTYENWWQCFRDGRVVVTNGPLLRPLVEGQYPGHTFPGVAGKKLRLQPTLQLATKDEIEYLEIVKNGEVVHSIGLDDYTKSQGRLPMVEFDTSGWFLIRAVTNVGKTYRFASTGPYYVDFGSQPRISRTAAEFFVDWVTRRARQLKNDQEALEFHREARDFWQDLADRSNAP